MEFEFAMAETIKLGVYQLGCVHLLVQINMNKLIFALK